ncbi:hypothetical protein HYW76_05080 [Candidatus Pacearchaeota archaeon]|nr:hypothetical protein [Candidatus Pacearchaeota archaeon]
MGEINTPYEEILVSWAEKNRYFVSEKRWRDERLARVNDETDFHVGLLCIPENPLKLEETLKERRDIKIQGNRELAEERRWAFRREVYVPRGLVRYSLYDPNFAINNLGDLQRWLENRDRRILYFDEVISFFIGEPVMNIKDITPEIRMIQAVMKGSLVLTQLEGVKFNLETDLVYAIKYDRAMEKVCGILEEFREKVGMVETGEERKLVKELLNSLGEFPE